MNIYLICSNSYHLLDDKLKELTNGIQDISKFSLNDTSIDNILENASYYGLFNDKKAIIVYDTKYFSGKFEYNDDMSKLDKFLNNDNDIVLIFVCDDILKTKDNTKLLLKYNTEIINLNNLSDKEYEDYIIKYCINNNIVLDHNAYLKLVEYTNSNIDIIINEIDKLSLLDKHITSSLVSDNTNEEVSDDVYGFTNACVSRNFNEAFTLLDNLFKNNIDSSIIVGRLASQYINLYMVKDAFKHGLSENEVSEALNYNNTKRVYILNKLGRTYTLDELKNIILRLSDIDKKIKTGYNPVYTLKEFLLSL